MVHTKFSQITVYLTWICRVRCSWSDGCPRRHCVRCQRQQCPFDHNLPLFCVNVKNVNNGVCTIHLHAQTQYHKHKNNFLNWGRGRGLGMISRSTMGQVQNGRLYIRYRSLYLCFASINFCAMIMMWTKKNFTVSKFYPILHDYSPRRSTKYAFLLWAKTLFLFPSEHNTCFFTWPDCIHA